MSTGTQLHNLNLDADRALFRGEIHGLVATFYENERPLAALAGLMDWRFQGAISQYLRTGAITGKLGQCAYLPMIRNGVTYHLILLGGGHSDAPGDRRPVTAETLRVLQKNLTTLQLQKVGISRSDFGNVSDDFFLKNVKGVPLWITT